MKKNDARDGILGNLINGFYRRGSLLTSVAVALRHRNNYSSSDIDEIIEQINKELELKL